MGGNRQAFRIIFLALLFMTGLTILARLAPWRAELAENNFQANLIRLEAFFFDPAPRTVLIGSSITGRLIPRYFSGSALGPIANLGLDGSGPSLGLELALSRPPPLLIVEVNQLLKLPDENDKLLRNTLQSLGFRASREILFLRAAARPSSVLYSALKARSKREAEAAPELAEKRTEPHNVNPAKTANNELSLVKGKIREQLRALHGAGSHVVLCRFPAGLQAVYKDHPQALFADELVKDLGVQQIDLASEMTKAGLFPNYTDGIHLTPASARQASKLLVTLVPEKAQERATQLSRRQASTVSPN